MNAQPRLTQAAPKSFPSKERFPPSCQYDPTSLNPAAFNQESFLGEQ